MFSKIGNILWQTGWKWNSEWEETNETGRNVCHLVAQIRDNETRSHYLAASS